jgi:hypothetical protein
MGDKKGKGVGAETNDHKVLMKLYIRALLTNLKRPLEKGQVFVLLDCLVCWDAIRVSIKPSCQERGVGWYTARSGTLCGVLHSAVLRAFWKAGQLLQ